MDTVTIGILLFWTPNKYNYLALRNLLSVLVYYLISLNCGMKTSHCPSYGSSVLLPITQEQGVCWRHCSPDLGAPFVFSPVNGSIAAGVVGDYSTLHVHSVLCLSLLWAMLTGVQRVCPRRPSTFHTSHYRISCCTIIPLMMHHFRVVIWANFTSVSIDFWLLIFKILWIHRDKTLLEYELFGMFSVASKQNDVWWIINTMKNIL